MKSQSKYTLLATDIEKIINVITKKNNETKIDYVDYDIDSAIYFFKKYKLYLINYDSIENKWYLSQIDEYSFKLIKEIYISPFNDFITFLQN